MNLPCYFIAGKQCVTADHLCDYCKVAEASGAKFPKRETVKVKQHETWVEFVERNGKETLEAERQ